MRRRAMAGVGLRSDHCRRHWPNIRPTLAQCLLCGHFDIAGLVWTASLGVPWRELEFIPHVFTIQSLSGIIIAMQMSLHYYPGIRPFANMRRASYQVICISLTDNLLRCDNSYLIYLFNMNRFAERYFTSRHVMRMTTIVIIMGDRMQSSWFRANGTF